jgi:hypothetical protein
MATKHNLNNNTNSITKQPNKSIIINASNNPNLFFEICKIQISSQVNSKSDWNFQLKINNASQNIPPKKILNIV